ncbi:esterase-like [Cornus florida]|uniref:esterase-like n=1 Tax=Cornus florida TaxID=4283 RepID=UPI00289CEB89|nr:esterase-like [Cornus florida]
MECLNMIKPVFTLSCFCMLLCYATVLNPVFADDTCDFPAIFNFGDSNSDTGGLQAAFNWTTPPYGQTFFHMPNGRYSDGRLIIDFIASRLGLPFLDAYLNSLGTNYTHGVNFATAAATITPPLFILPVGGYSPIYLDVQVGEFEQFINRSQFIKKSGGIFKDLMPEEDSFEEALYTFDIGHNDMAMELFANWTVEEVNASIPTLINGLSNAIKDVYKLGGRSFWVQNTDPMGCLPLMLTSFPEAAAQNDSAGCAIPFNQLSQYYNYKLKEAVAQLRKDLPLAAITYVDVYTIKYDIISHPQKYGLSYPTISCCGYGGKYNYSAAVCGSTVIVNGSEFFVGSCEDPSKRINWDGVHYTEAVNKIIVDHISTGNYSDPPIPLNMVCHRELED